MKLGKIEGKMRTFSFLNNLDNDLRISLLCALRDKWTHSSTALEGNSFTLGDTEFFLKLEFPKICYNFYFNILISNYFLL
ncbi:MAG: hypothetical protein LBO64_00795 [Desulfovibrio sp.]|jgi:hypothetical protein|nr:hypothetical protein [Desulfovibrio sp.]